MVGGAAAGPRGFAGGMVWGCGVGIAPRPTGRTEVGQRTTRGPHPASRARDRVREACLERPTRGHDVAEPPEGEGPGRPVEADTT